MKNKMKLYKVICGNTIVLGVSLLLASCGGSTTVADRDNNFSGSYTGTVSLQGGGTAPATLNLIQSSSTSGTGDNATTTVNIRGLLVIDPNGNCGTSTDITEGTANNNSIILELGTTTETKGEGDDKETKVTDSGDLALTASGRVLTGSIRFTPDLGGSCRKPSGSVSFRR